MDQKVRNQEAGSQSNEPGSQFIDQVFRNQRSGSQGYRSQEFGTRLQEVRIRNNPE
jgi:hypothetical protein